MGNITDQLSKLLGQNSGAPFLFVGSGFSRRYIGLEQWDELLSRFCEGIREFGFYASQHNYDMPKAASAMSEDFNNLWWNDQKYVQSREEYRAKVITKSSALKYEISSYLVGKVHEKTSGDIIAMELELLSRLNVDGIITTNWDLFLEELFPDYKVFVGQEELLFSNPQSIAEIYKIHGCASQPESLVLTYEDYRAFDLKNPYLAAKLITIFIEHPVIFVGYSLGDKNIQTIISSIVNCLGQDKLDAFGRNLIFLQRCEAQEPASFQPSIISIGDTNLNITVVKTNNFSEVYEAVESTKRKIPARILRYCKEQMYDLVKSVEPSHKLAVVDIDQIEAKDDIEFVVGVGVAEVSDRISRRGYKGVAPVDIFADLINEHSAYNADELLSGVYPSLFKQPNHYIPAYRYLRRAGISNIADLRASKHSAVEKILNKSKKVTVPGYQRQYDKQYKGKSTAEIIDMTSPEKAALMLPFQSDQEIDIDLVESFLRDHSEKFRSEVSSYSSYFRKLACLYDRLKYGF